MGIHINDVPVDLFFKYFNETNASTTKNKMLTEELSVNIKGAYYSNNVYFQNNPDSSIKTFFNITRLSTSTENNNHSILIFPKMKVSINTTMPLLGNKFDNPIINIGTENIQVIEKGNISRDALYCQEIIKGKIEGESIVFSVIEPKLRKQSSSGYIIKVDNLDYEFGSIDFTEDDTTISRNVILEKMKNNENIQYEKYNSDNRLIASLKYREKIGYLFFSSVSESEFLIRVFFKPFIKLVPKRNKDGNILYKDNIGIITDQEIYENNFLKHRNILRKIFFGLSEKSGWMYSKNITLGKNIILQQGETNNLKHRFGYTYEIETENAYSIVNSIPEGTILSDDSISKSTYDEILNSPDNKFIKSDYKRYSILSKFIEDIPEVKTYINYNKLNVENTDEFKISSIEDDNEYDVENGKLVKLSCYTRTIKLGSFYDISEDNIIEIPVSIGNENSSLNKNKNRYSIFNANSDEPYIIIPLFKNNESIVNKTIKIGNITGIANLNSIKFNNNKIVELLYAEKLGISEDIIRDIYVGDYSEVLFIKFPLPKIEEILHSSFIGNLKRYSREVDVSSPNTYRLSGDDSFFLISTNEISGDVNTETIESPTPIKQKNTDKQILQIDANNESSDLPREVQIRNSGVVTKNFITYTSSNNTLIPSQKVIETYYKFNTDINSYLDFNMEKNIYINPTKTIYYKDIYSSGEGSFIKEEITTRFKGNYEETENENIITVLPNLRIPADMYCVYPLSRSIYNNSNKKFKIINDNLLNMRGSIVNEGIILKERKDAFANSINSILDNSGKDEFYTPDGLMRLYNYTKSVIQTNLNLNQINSTNSYENISKDILDSELNRVILEKRKIQDFSEVPEDIQESYGVVRERNLIEKILQHSEFPNEESYEKNELLESKLDYINNKYGEKSVEKNINMKFYNKNRIDRNRESYIEQSRVSRQNISNILTEYFFSFKHDAYNKRIKDMLDSFKQYSGDLEYPDTYTSSAEKIVYSDIENLKSTLTSLCKITDDKFGYEVVYE